MTPIIPAPRTPTGSGFVLYLLAINATTKISDVDA
jgi:hypothetical protein